MTENGRICIILAGRRAGKHCIMIGEKDGMSLILLANGKKRKCNPKHLWLTEKKIETKEEGKIQEKLKELDK